jgi:hypothetical protein
MKRFLALSLLLLGPIAACGGDGGGTGPTQIDLTGTWAVTMSPITGHGVTCTVVGMQVQVSQTGNDLTGTYTVDDMICNGQHSGSGTGTIVNGTEVNGQLHFHFDTEDFDLHGTARGPNACSGTYTIVIEGLTFTGTWTASRM